MSNQDSPARLAKAHVLVTELRTLQARLNETVDQLCELVGGSSIAALLQSDVIPRGSRGEPMLTPIFLTTPAAQTYVRGPSPGSQVSADTVFFSDYEKGLVQLVQQPLPRHADTRYSFIINFADFDGHWMSLVVDAKSLLRDQPAGKAILGLMVEVTGTSQVVMSSKISWRTPDHLREIALDVRPNQVCVAQADLGYINPTATEALDLHVMFNPPGRGSIEIRRLTLTLDVHAEPAHQQQLEGVFEDGL